MLVNSMADYEQLLELMRYDYAEAVTGGTNVLSNSVPEDRVYYPVGMIASDNSGAANTLDIQKQEEDDTNTDVAPNINFTSNETKFISTEDVGVWFPRLEGDTNFHVVAGSDGIDVTLFYIPNEV